jgi:hypothetical protein
LPKVKPANWMKMFSTATYPPPGGVQQLRTCDRQRAVDRVRVEGVVAKGGELEVRLGKGTDNTVFGVGAGIDRQRHAGASREVVAIAVPLAEVAVPGWLAVNAAVEGDVGAYVTAELDAGVGTGDEEEAGAVKRADLHILDGFRLDRKIRRVCTAGGHQTCGGAKDQGSHCRHHGLRCELHAQSPAGRPSAGLYVAV